MLEDAIGNCIDNTTHQQRSKRRSNKGNSNTPSSAELAKDVRRPPTPHNGGVKDEDLLLFYITYDRMVTKADQVAYDAHFMSRRAPKSMQYGHA